MKAPPFSYVRAATLTDAFQLWRDAGPDAKLLAGGQSLLATLAFRLSEPSTLIDISRVRELRGIAQAGAVIRVGALTTHAELGRHELLRQHVPLLAEAVPLIAHPAIRNRGTIGGSLAFADPAAELPACCVALDAMIVARNAADERRIPAPGILHRALRHRAQAQRADRRGRVPRRQGGRARHHPGAGAPLGRLRHGRRGGEGQGHRQHAVDPRFVFFGVGDGPVLADQAMAAISGQQVLPDTIAAAQAALDGDLDPPSDQHGGREMKLHLARVLLARALRRLAGIEEARAA